MIVLDLEYNELPPTSNKIYIRGTMLTAAAKQFAENFSMAMRHYLYQVNKVDDTAIYAVHLRFYFHKLINESWNNPKVAPSRRAKTRYKRIDLDNRIKLVTDCIRDFMGVDDSQTFAGSQEKHQCGPGEKERVRFIVQKLDPTMFGI